jgi:hypothetical protein
MLEIEQLGSTIQTRDFLNLMRKNFSPNAYGNTLAKFIKETVKD